MQRLDGVYSKKNSQNSLKSQKKKNCEILEELINTHTRNCNPSWKCKNEWILWCQTQHANFIATTIGQCLELVCKAKHKTTRYSTSSRTGPIAETRGDKHPYICIYWMTTEIIDQKKWPVALRGALLREKSRQWGMRRVGPSLPADTGCFKIGISLTFGLMVRVWKAWDGSMIVFSPVQRGPVLNILLLQVLH